MPYLLAAAAFSAVALSSPQPVPAASSLSSVLLAWRFAPAAHCAYDARMTHVVSNDLNGVYRKLAGHKADPVTILEDRSGEITVGHDGAVNESIVDVRRYGGLQAKDNSSVRRTAAFKGTIAPNGTRTPSGDTLGDPGDGALAQLPAGPVAPGQSWTFSRTVLLDRDLGKAVIAYTDTLLRVDTRAGRRYAIIDVKGRGRADVAADLKAKGFGPADLTLQGAAEFDLSTGLPGVQHYVAHVQWNSHVLWVHVGLIFDDTFDEAPWSQKAG